jgi:predicted nucleic acid-binding protein
MFPGKRDHFRHLVAATADIKGYEPATLNVKHFPMFKTLSSFGASTERRSTRAGAR